jgi:hypothetical protein
MPELTRLQEHCAVHMHLRTCRQSVNVRTVPAWPTLCPADACRLVSVAPAEHTHTGL